MPRSRHPRLRIGAVLAALGVGTFPAGVTNAQTPPAPSPLPPAISDPPPRTAFPPPPVPPLGSDSTALGPGPAPMPIAGPAGEGIAIGGTDNLLPQGMPINLATAMSLAGARPLDIATATAQVRQALALQLQAKVLWIPNLNAGVDYFRHDGVQQQLFTGPNFRKGRQDLFVGGGPTLNVSLADAIYAPLAAKRVTAARTADVQTARNDSLLAVAQAFFILQDARGRLLGVRASMERADLLVNFARSLAPSLIAPLEVNRAKAELQSLRQTQQLALRDWRTASARLAEILLIDPSTLLEPVEPPFLQVTLINPACSSGDLVPVALRNRPEIASRADLVAAAEQLLKEEKRRPFLPNLYIISPSTATGLMMAGNNSAGANNSLGSNGSRMDVELAAVWQLQNGGLGNVGRIRQRKAEQDVAAIDLTRTVFRVRSEVAQALARLQTARVRVVETGEGVRQAVESADKNFIGLRETARPAGELLRLIVRPQEVVAAIIALETAYEQYSEAVNEYNVAQFETYRAMGQPAQWVTAKAAADAAAAPPPPETPAPAPAQPPPGRPAAR